MVKKNQKWEWKDRQEETFRELKKRFTKELVLAVPDLDKENENRSRYVRLYYRGSVIYGMQRWKMVTNNFSLKIFK